MYREDFPQIRDDFAYLDNAATTYKPKQVISAISNYYEHLNANPGHGLYDDSISLSAKIDEIREQIKRFLGADDSYSVIFTHSATESFNMLAQMFSGKTVAISRLEHHSNLLPWRKHCKTKIIECDKSGRLDEIIPEADILAITGMSNVLGTIPNLDNVLTKSNSITILDATQMVVHAPVDITKRGIDFAVFSGHKLYAPMGIGVICGKTSILEQLTPAFWGGGIVDSVTDSDEALSEIPAKFEAGTLNAAGIIGLGAAIEYLESKTNIFEYEAELSAYLEKKLQEINHLHFFGSGGIYSFIIDGVHPHDIAGILSADGIAVRAGYHCAEPLLIKLEIGPTTRISLSFYNTKDEIDRLATSLATIRKRMGYE